MKKFGDDQAGQLAALISYYGFVSLFPLMLVFVTILGFVLEGHPHEREELLNGTLGQFPIISDQLKFHSLSGSAPALAIGLVLALLAGLGITNASQSAFNRIWNVPYKHRPNCFARRLRGLGDARAAGHARRSPPRSPPASSAPEPHGAVTVVAGVVVALAFNLALFMLAFKLLTAIDLGWRELLPGVILASVFWQLLQHLGGLYVDHALKRTGPLYGVFALVLGLLAWLYLGAQLTIFAAEVNVVRKHRLWPRSFFSERLLETDKQALAASAEVEERVDRAESTSASTPPDVRPLFGSHNAISGTTQKVLAHATTPRYTNYTFVSSYGAIPMSPASEKPTVQPSPRRAQAPPAADPARRHRRVPQHGHHADGRRRRRRARRARPPPRERVPRGRHDRRGLRADPPPRRRPRRRRSPASTAR